MQRNTKIILISCVIAVVAVIAGVVSTLNSGNDDSAKANQSSSTQNTSQPSAQQSSNNAEENTKKEVSITLDDLKTHNTVGNCWTAINGSIYDLTTYIQKHPGGGEIIRACGADGTSLFTQRTTEDGKKVGTGTAHSQNAVAQLNDLKIGTLKEE